MTTDFRVLCAELLQALTTTNLSAFGKFAELEDRARAALSQPEPEVVGPPSDCIDALCEIAAKLETTP